MRGWRTPAVVPKDVVSERGRATRAVRECAWKWACVAYLHEGVVSPSHAARWPTLLSRCIEGSSPVSWQMVLKISHGAENDGAPNTGSKFKTPSARVPFDSEAKAPRTGTGRVSTTFAPPPFTLFQGKEMSRKLVMYVPSRLVIQHANTDHADQS